MSENVAPAVIPSKRKRARRACEPCRKRKKKCDGKEPCQLCQEYEYMCTYAPEDLSNSQLAPTGQLQSTRAGLHPPLSGERNLAHGVDEDRLMFDARKGFLVDASSVLAFPRLLAKSLESGQPPSLRNLVYNLGIRQERYFVQGTTLGQIVSLEDAQRYSLVFFRIVNPWHAYLDQAEYMAHLTKHYIEKRIDAPLEMMVAFVVALGSYFSWPDRFSKEEELVEHAITWMDPSVLEVPAQVCLNYAGSWIARSIYHRATGSPRTAWISSCTAMHIVEWLGLHKEWHTITKLANPATEMLSDPQLEHRRRIYWSAFTVNRLISTEYGRSSVEIAGANCEPVDWKPGETFQLLVDIARSLPHAVNPNEKSGREDYIEAIEKLAREQQEHDPLYIALVRGDVACLLYRRLNLMNIRLTDDVVKHILSLGQKGTEAACKLAIEKQPWWKVISTPFQFLCVLLSLDTCDSLKLVPEVLRALLQISEIFETQRTKEAYETAQLLVQIAQQKKEKELNCLKEGLAVTSTNPNNIMSEAWADMDINWMDLMDPDLFSMESII